MVVVVIILKQNEQLSDKSDTRYLTLIVQGKLGLQIKTQYFIQKQQEIFTEPEVQSVTLSISKPWSVPNGILHRRHPLSPLE